MAVIPEQLTENSVKPFELMLKVFNSIAWVKIRKVLLYRCKICVFVQ